MKIIFLVRVLLCFALVIAIAAPFTFLVPKPLMIIEETIAEAVAEKVVVPVVEKVKVIEKPLHQVNLPDFAAIYDIPTKKRQFFAFIRPAIEAKNNELAQDRTKLAYWHEQISIGLGLTDEEQASLQILINTYRINKKASTLQQINDLMVRVDIIPTSLVLVQAANESAWGTSRFARIGLNFFGIWCYRTGCGMVPGGRNTGAKHEVAAFQSVDAAVSGYFNNINKHNAYHVFRTIRAELRAQDQPLSSEILATGLLPYSERGAQYVLDITDMLRHNRRYFVEPTDLQAALAD
ncbi:glucosaminidase domain-containing protein [Colwellia psychrerythraea]|uniref:Mannosyl-glycoprotein endo-beta-N-acetylglucosamidase n=1 Tax=Colwellia psychrerythraea TaxID=28229 RepID=A0A099L676_COLPS|nr:glucosaminidase domain-containing protein [Colwellia psychrerythraea]KGJ97940.1 Mannosyl-glycoprotein endo-beta-N-acetylglucosamidase [Colwellia psychrerythraea]